MVHLRKSARNAWLGMSSVALRYSAAAEPAAACRAIANNMIIGTSEGWSKTMQLIGVGYRAAVSGSKLILNLGYSNPVEFDIPNGLSCKVRPALCCASFECRSHWSGYTTKCMVDCCCPSRSPRCRPVVVSLHSLLAGKLQVPGLLCTYNSNCACPATLSCARTCERVGHMPDAAVCAICPPITAQTLACCARVNLDSHLQVEKLTTLTVSGYDKGDVGQFAAKIREKRPPEPYKGKGIRYVGEYVRRKEGKRGK